MMIDSRTNCSHFFSIALVLLFVGVELINAFAVKNASKGEAGTTANCGHRPHFDAANGAAQMRVSNGIQVPDIRKWPWLAAVLVLSPHGSGGGDERGVGTFPVSVRQKCTASIVGKRHLLTAAHCNLNRKSTDFVIAVGNVDNGEGSSIVDIDGGLIRQPRRQLSSSLSAGEFHRVKRVIVHPHYTGISDANGNDIALIELEHPLQFDDRKQPICLPKNFDQERSGAGNMTAVIAGWGSTYVNDFAKEYDRIQWARLHQNHTGQYENNNSNATLLYEGIVQVMQMQACDREELERWAIQCEQGPKACAERCMALPESKRKCQEFCHLLTRAFCKAQTGIGNSNADAAIKSKYVCAQGEVSNVEKGDSGGPLMMPMMMRTTTRGNNDRKQQREEEERWFQFGVTHKMIPRMSVEEKRNPSVFISVSAHCDWIASETAGEVECHNNP